MSYDDSSHQADAAERQPSLVSDVQFTAVNDSSKPKQPTSSRGESLRREKEKWSMRGERLREKLLTPPNALSHRKSDNVNSKGERSLNSEYDTPPESRSASSSTNKAQSEGRDGSHAESKRRINGSETSSFDIVDSPASSSLQSRQKRFSATPSMDPAQLVQMALNLSENRRRHASNPVAAIQRPNSSQFSDRLASSLHSDHNRELVGPRLSDSKDQRMSAAFSDEDQYYFSPATLARAEKARRYFELADKHRRLLQQLPPVPQNKQSGRSRALSRVSARSHVEQDEDVPLDRQYNPLQALRNRRTRQQQNFELPVAQFQDLDKVERWVSQIEQASGVHEGPGKASLPTYEIDGDSNTTGKGHKRTGTADTVITRPQYDWSISPAELIADTYWTEQGRNASFLQSSDKRRGTISRHRASTAGSADIKDGLVSSAAGDNNDEVRHSHRHLLPLSAANRLRQHKFTRHRSASVSSASSTEGPKRHLNDLNIGPLQRHMDQMIQRDAEETASSAINSPDRWETSQSRHKSIDHHYHHTRSPRITARHNGQVLVPLDEASGQIASPKAVSTSPEASHPASPIMDKVPIRVDRQASLEPHHEHDEFHDNHIAGTSVVDFTKGTTVERRKQEETIDPSRLSVEAARPPTFKRHKTGESITSIKDVISRTKTDSSEASREPASAVTRFLRGGRDMVRNESVRFGNRIRGRDRRGGDTSDVSAANSDVSDTEGGPTVKRGRVTTSAEQSDVSPRASLEKQRPRYHVSLPSFKPPQARDGAFLTPNDSTDHISRQSHLRKRDRSPRFEKLAPPRISLPNEDEEGRYIGLIDDRRKSYGFLNPALRNRSRSHSKTPSWLGRTRQQNTATVLSPVSTQTSGGSRQWSISDKQPPGIFSNKDNGVSPRDVARVRTLLLASGIKAREISRRLNSPSAETPAFLLRAAKISDLDESAIEKRPSKLEPTYAFELLSGIVEGTFKSLAQEIEAFQTEDLQALIARQDRLKARVAEDLTELVHSASDQADAFNIEISTQATLRTKSVDDMIDAVLRLRRRQFRLLRQAAFKMLEWFTLSILWLVWFVVVCFKTMQRIIVGIFRLLRWLIVF